jgi:serine protease AprX
MKILFRFFFREVFAKAGLLIVFFLLMVTGFGQNKYWVVFADKAGVSFDPLAYFEPLALERRVRAGLPLCDASDYPLNPSYVQAVASLTDSTGYSSRWFNMLSVWASPEQVNQVSLLPFVVEVVPQVGRFFPAQVGNSEKADATPYRLIQTERFGARAFEAKGFNGQGLRIAVLDAGFSDVQNHPAFLRLREDNRIVKTWDFIRKDELVYGFGSHGRAVLSCITGQKGDTLIGLASKAEFLLARTEYSHSEPFSEEEFWLAASEWADKNGAHIINSSLGYTKDRYFPWKMDGKTSFVVRAANKAAGKGILVVNSAGNEGDSDWRYIGTPADADSVLSVGGIDPGSDLRISYSSFGPTSDRRLKPNVTAISHVLAADEKDYSMSDGTSFSSPLVAGFAACAWQSRPHLTNMELFREIERSGHLYPYYDYAHGYGVPQASFFTDTQIKDPVPCFELRLKEDTVEVYVTRLPENLGQSTTKEFGNGHVVITIPTDTQNGDNAVNEEMGSAYLYYHIQNQRGFLDKYAVLLVQQNQVIQFSKEELAGRTLRVSHKGFMKEFKF